MSENLEGTFTLDGIVEGPLPSIPNAQQCLRDWANTAARSGVCFSIECDGGTFSALAMDRVMSAVMLGDVVETLQTHLNELLSLFPPLERTSVLSTVRSMEYHPGEELQTLYAVGPTGEIITEQRSVEVHTVAPARPLTRREKLKMAGISVLILLAMFGISAIFVDYPGMWKNVRDKASSLNPAEMEWVNQPLKPYLQIEKTEFPKSSILKLTMKRTPAFPTTPERLNQAARDAKTLEERLAIEAIGRGYLRGEWYDKEGNFLGQTPVRIKGLRTHETVLVEIPVPVHIRPHRFVLTY